MIAQQEIIDLLKGYDKNKISIATICSHSALQIFHGAKQEGFRTIGIIEEGRKNTYDSFPLAKPDEYIVVKKSSDISGESFQEELRNKNAIVVPHGSFVEFVGPKNLENNFLVPMFGNRKTLEWENDRKKQREWLEKSGIKMPKEFSDPSLITGKVFVKFHGAKGGRGFFTTNSEKDFYEKLKGVKEKGKLLDGEAEKFSIQEFVPGVRYYVHYFHSPIFDGGRTEMLGMDKRIEPIDEAYRGLPDVPEEFFDYTVTGNQPVVIRESLLPRVIKMGQDVVKISNNLFSPGMIGPFCLETVFHPDRGFTVFEISARIVAGTNLYPLGSQYSCYLFNEPMSTGRRIAREIKTAGRENCFEKTIY